MKKNQTKQLVVTAMCIALGVVLPFTLHSIPKLGNILLPMHLPVLLCGLLVGWPYGLASGILTPLLSSLLTGMPPMAYLPSMLFELAAYGLMAGLLKQFVHTKKRVIELYIQLIGAMLVGRIVYGVLNALIFSVGNFTFNMFLLGAFVTALPGIIIQLVLIPAVILILEKAGAVDRNLKTAIELKGKSVLIKKVER